jgi:hypothetical protein
LQTEPTEGFIQLSEQIADFPTHYQLSLYPKCFVSRRLVRENKSFILLYFYDSEEFDDSIVIVYQLKYVVESSAG